jgi:hypothetical protein
MQKKYDELAKQMSELKTMYAAETQVREEIIAKLLKEKSEHLFRIREMAYLLKIPRLHFDYIKQHGVDDFVDRCKEYVDYNDWVHEEKERSHDRLKAREADAVHRFEDTSLNGVFRKANK